MPLALEVLYPLAGVVTCAGTVCGVVVDADESSENLEPAELTDEEVGELTEAESEAEPVAYSGTDFDAEGLVRRLTRGDIIIPNFGHGDESIELAGFQ